MVYVYMVYVEGIYHIYVYTPFRFTITILIPRLNVMRRWKLFLIVSTNIFNSFNSLRLPYRAAFLMTAETITSTSKAKMKGSFEREIVCTDAVAWLKSSSVPLNGSVFTSMPDISELNDIFRGFPDIKSRALAYEEWFTDTAQSILGRLRDGAYAIFLQSDVRVIDGGNVVHWIDKSKLCSTAADKVGCNIMWHKMTLNTNMDKKSVARPSYSHLIVNQF